MTHAHFDPVLEAALARIQTAAVAAVDKVSTQLGPLSTAATSNLQRQTLMNAERALKLKSAALIPAFAGDFRHQTDKALRPMLAEAHTGSGGFSPDTDWTALSLVDNAEVERGVTADRLGQALAHECEGELEAVYAFTSGLWPDLPPERNPLRPQAVAQSLTKAMAEVGIEEDLIPVLMQHFGRVLGPELAQAYALTVGEMRSRGIRPQGPSVQRSRSPSSGFSASRPAELGAAHTQPGSFPESMGGRLSSPGHLQAETHLRAAQALSEMFGVSMPGAPLDGPAPMGLGATRVPGGLPSGNADFQHLLRQIALQAPPTAGDTADFLHAEGFSAPAGAASSMTAQPAGFAGPLMAVNLIRAHRDELVRASGGAALDKMVIDIVAALFDQVLSDPKVAPQMARQIARLQMPVLRVALGDMAFFNSRKHPVRRFVNRIASLSASFEDYEEGPGRSCLDRITSLVDDIVDGDFDRIDLYEAKLAELEAFIESENAREAAESAAVAALLTSKEADLRVQQRYMQILKRELADVEMPDFVRDFLSQVWSQVQVMASARDGAQSPLAARMKKAGHDLALSVQPKGHPQLRKDFLLKLPQLMKDLNEGLGLIQWADEAKQQFFSQLLPAHAECLKTAPHHDLTQRLLEQQLNKVEQLAIPSREEAANDPLPAALDDLKSPPVLTVVSALSPAEVQQAGFLAEATVACDAPLDIDLDTPAESDPSLSEIDINLDAPPPPNAGVQLIHHIQKGTAYQMMMQGQWKRVRLTWVSEGRNFFIFSHGHTHKQTISLTARTLARMCDSGRFKAFEQSELIERATVRARRQLAALSATTRTAA
ncbi:MAG: DUF1631 family protein [Aquabacterium sp.]